jgi:cytochrome P450
LFGEVFPNKGLFTCNTKYLDDVLSFLQTKNIDYQVLGGELLCHTPQMQSLRDESYNAIGDIFPSQPQIDLYSTFSGGHAADGAYFDFPYWSWASSKGTWHYSAMKEAMLDGYDTVVLLGASVWILEFLANLSRDLNREIDIFETLREDESELRTFERSYRGLVKIHLVGQTDSHATHAGVKSGLSGVPKPAAPSINLSTDTFVQKPYQHYEALRRSGSVQFLNQDNCWIVLDYDDVASALKRHDEFSNAPLRSVDPVLSGADPPDHTRARYALMAQFSARGLSTAQAQAQITCERLLDQLSSQPEFDIVHDYAHPFAQEMLSHVIGLTENDLNDLKQAVPGTLQDEQHLLGIETFYSAYVDKVTAVPGENLCSRLLSNTSGFTKEEIVNLLKTIWLAGTTSPAALIANSVGILLDHYAVRLELQRDISLVPQFVEEVLRFNPPEHFVKRMTRRETQLGGVSIPANADIKLCLAAANRDTKHYSNAEFFILNRNPRDHLAFGGGSHFCLGAMLARIEANVAIKALLERYPLIKPGRPRRERHYRMSRDVRILESLIVGYD